MFCLPSIFLIVDKFLMYPRLKIMEILGNTILVVYRNINTTPEICWLYCRQRYKASNINDFLPFSFFSSFVKDALTKNPKRRPTAEKMLYHKFLLAGDLNMRLSLELLNKVRNPEAASLSTSSSTSGLPSSSQGMKAAIDHSGLIYRHKN